MNPDSRIGLVWFRQNLRLHDNETLAEAIRHCDQLYFVYVYDPRTLCGTTSFGFEKTGPYRAQFIIDSVTDLQKNLNLFNAKLQIVVGEPEIEVAALAKELKTSWVFCNRERTDEELKVQDRLEKNLWVHGIEIRFSRGKMLYHTQDLPFPVAHTPDTFTTFRKEVERFTPVREPLPSPTEFKQGPLLVDRNAQPTLADFDLEWPENGIKLFEGGETAALARLKHYLWDTQCIKTYKETRNELLGLDYSSKFSTYLAHGCLSPKLIYAELMRFEAEVVANESTYWLFFELLWRDYFRLVAKKYQNKIFQLEGTRGKNPKKISDNDRLFEKWANGATGEPFVDANMIELNRTGYMSNRGRQNVASYLVNNMGQNWLKGAEYFESLLIDYDPASNYGNWNYLAGVGADPREDRVFNIDSQAKRYDPDGKYMNHWLGKKAQKR